MANLIVDITGIDIGGQWNKRIIRTSDGTIHVVIRKDTSFRVYHSTNNGQTWFYETVYDWVGGPASICKDSNDNLGLGIVTGPSGSKQVMYFKGTVNKTGTPWTWSWGSFNLVNTSYNIQSIDMEIDGNNYIHIVGFRGSYLDGFWFRSINNGVNWTTTQIAADPVPNAPMAICKDTSNNLFVCWSTNNEDPVRGLKITYNGGTSWSVGPIITIRNSETHNGALHILPDNRIVLSHAQWYASDQDRTLYFRKSINPSDLTSWFDPITIAQVPKIKPYPTIMVIDSQRILIFYNNTSGKFCYRRTIDGGNTFESEVLVVNDSTVNSANAGRSAYNGKTDFVYRIGTSSQIYQDIYIPPIELSDVVSFHPWIMIDIGEEGGILLGDIRTSLSKIFKTETPDDGWKYLIDTITKKTISIKEEMIFFSEHRWLGRILYEVLNLMETRWIGRILYEFINILDMEVFPRDIILLMESLHLRGRAGLGQTLIVYLTWKKINGIRTTFKRIYDAYLTSRRE